jgi:hypothetical protein
VAHFSKIFSVRKAFIADAVQILDCLKEAFAPFRDAYTPEAFLDTVLTPAALEQRLKIMPCLWPWTVPRTLWGLWAVSSQLQGKVIFAAWRYVRFGKAQALRQNCCNRLSPN